MTTPRLAQQYHLALEPGQVAPNVMLVGDPARAQLVAGMLDNVEHTATHREFVAFTGKHEGLPVTVVATGIGPDNMEIVVVELCQCVSKPTLIRCGTCGALQPDIDLGDLVITHGAYRLENTSTFFVGEGFPAVADPCVVLALVQAADEAAVPFHVGITATAPGFYGAQSRRSPGFVPRSATMLDELATQGVKNIEMEISVLLSLATISNCRAGAICTVFAQRHRDAFIDTQHRSMAERTCVEVGLRAFHHLARQDDARGSKPIWHPGLGGSPAR